MGRDSRCALLMATRAHTIIAGIISKLEAITPDEQSGSADKFRHNPGIDVTDAAISRDRAFAIAPASPVVRDMRYISSTTPAVCSAEFDLAVAYQATRHARDRILKDSERILVALETFQGENSSDVLEVSISSGTITPLDRTVLTEFVVLVTYQLDI